MRLVQLMPELWLNVDSRPVHCVVDNDGSVAVFVDGTTEAWQTPFCFDAVLAGLGESAGLVRLVEGFAATPTFLKTINALEFTNHEDGYRVIIASSALSKSLCFTTVTDPSSVVAVVHLHAQ